jgi:uncharacterized protein
MNLKWPIQQLNKNKEMAFDETVDLSDIMKLNAEIRNISPVHVIGRLVVGTNMFTFPMKIEGTLTLPCSRTLVDVELPFDIEIRETFQQNKGYNNASEQGEDSDIHIIDGDVIDLAPYIKEHILLEIPLQIFSENAETEALRSGKDWEFLTEENKENRIDPRLADLSKFFEKNGEK